MSDKSRLVTEFLRHAGIPAVYHTGTKQPAGRELALFADRIGESDLPTAAMVRSGTSFDTWEAAFHAIASSATTASPVAVVLDELPYIADRDPSFEAQLQAIWDRIVEPASILLIVIGSDLAMMEAMTSDDRPLYGHPTRQLIVQPLRTGEVGRLLDVTGADAVDATLMVGGFPLLVLSWPTGTSREDFLAQSVNDPTSALITSADRTLAAEFPEPEARAILESVGAGDVSFARIATRTQIPQTTIRRVLDTLVAKRVVSVDRPLSVRRTRRLTRYTVVDPYLRFWLRFIGPGLPEIERGRADLVIERITRDWETYRGHAVEPLVRTALQHRLPLTELGAARVVGSYWERTGTVEVDLVGTAAPEDIRRVEFVGSIKWRSERPFRQDDLLALAKQRDAVPGADENTLLVAVTRSGITAHGADATFGPDLLLDPA